MLYVVGVVLRGVTVLDNIMYVVCKDSSTIRLYNTDTSSPLDAVIHVEGMKDPLDIVVCRDDRQLYVADSDYFSAWSGIWRVSCDDHSYVKWLSTESTTDAFSADKLALTSRRLLVTSSGSGRLLQYSLSSRRLVTPVLPRRRLHQYSTTDRQLLRVVELPQYVSHVWHGVETTRGTFVVGHEGTSKDQPLQHAVSERLTVIIASKL